VLEPITSTAHIPIEEIWIIREGVCIFHECWTDKPLNLNIQLFSAFTSAVNSFSKSTLPSEQLRNIDFENTSLVLEPLPEYSILFVIKFSNIGPEKQIYVIENIIRDIKSFILDFELNELFSVQNSNLPITAYSLPLSNFFKKFINELNENEKEIRKIDLLSIIQLAETLYNKCRTKIHDLDKISLDLNNVFNSLLVNQSTSISTDHLPTVSRRDLKNQFSDFVSNLRIILKKNLQTSLQKEILKFFTSNYKLIKTYELDEAIVLNLLPVFHEDQN
jgi:hypothetical protein